MKKNIEDSLNFDEDVEEIENGLKMENRNSMAGLQNKLNRFKSRPSLQNFKVILDNDKKNGQIFGNDKKNGQDLDNDKKK